MDIAWLYAGLLECLRTGVPAARVCQINLTVHDVFWRFAVAQYLGTIPVERLGDFRADDEECATPIRNHAAVEAMQRIRNHR